jgi:tryptophan synthase alpha subunit
MEPVFLLETIVLISSLNVTLLNQLDVKIDNVIMIDLNVQLSKDVHKDFIDVKMDLVYLILRVVQSFHALLT